MNTQPLPEALRDVLAEMRDDAETARNATDAEKWFVPVITFERHIDRIDRILSEHGGGGEAEPVAWCEPNNPLNSAAFAWPGTAREPRHSMPLYTTPQPVEARAESVEQFVERVIANWNTTMSLGALGWSTDYWRGFREAIGAFQLGLRKAALAAASGEGSAECPCGEATCEEPWERGCGLGTSMEHARVAPDSTPPPASQSAEVNSRSRMRRVAVEKGEAAPRFDGEGSGDGLEPHMHYCPGCEEEVAMVTLAEALAYGARCRLDATLPERQGDNDGR